MNTYLHFLSQEEAHIVFRRYLKHHFPADEVKPWKSISRMWADGCYFAVGVFEDVGDVRPDSQNSSGANESDPLDTLRGYAFFVESPDCDACLLDYYAILPEYRDAGLGGRTLQRLAELVRDRGKYILLETEDIDFAKNDGQVAERTRRDAFYTRNGCVKTDVKGKVFTVHYAVWTLGLEAAHGADEAARSTAFDRACADMNTLYQLMIPGEKFRLFVKIVRASET